jgi:hypothetical protein
MYVGSRVDLLNIKNFFMLLLIIITLSSIITIFTILFLFNLILISYCPAATSTCQSFSMRTSPGRWHIFVIFHIIIPRAVVGTWVGITADCHVTSRQILPTGGSLDPSSLIELSDIISYLDPPFFLMVQHSAPDKIKMKQGFRRLSKQDKKGIGTRLDQRNGFRSSLENPDHPVFTEKIYAQNIV